MKSTRKETHGHCQEPGPCQQCRRQGSPDRAAGRPRAWRLACRSGLARWPPPGLADQRLLLMRQFLLASTLRAIIFSTIIDLNNEQIIEESLIGVLSHQNFMLDDAFVRRRIAKALFTSITISSGPGIGLSVILV